MHRLSIVIPCLVFNEGVEDTLVSVLQNLPPHSEVIVVTAGPYDDPYELEGEVRFVEAAEGSSLVQLANRGFAAARGEVIHLLQPGAQAVDGWTDAVLEHFEDADVGAVSPAVVQSAGDERALWLGIGYWSCGIRRVIGRGARLSGVRRQDPRVLGPSFFAGFYRRDVLSALDYFDDRLVPSCADVDLALSLHHLGQRTIVEPACRVVVQSDDTAPPASFQTARHRERLYRRHAPAGWLVRCVHGLVVCGEILRRFPTPRCAAVFLGRLVGGCEPGTRARQEQRTTLAAEHLAQLAAEARPAAIRVDFSQRDSHAGSRGRTQRRRAA